MSSRQSTVDLIVEQMAKAGVVSARKMFGEYGVYCDGKMVTLVCDDQLFVKPTAAGRAFIGEGHRGRPLQGSETMLPHLAREMGRPRMARGTDQDFGGGAAPSGEKASKEMIIRREEPPDIPVIRKLIVAVFPTPAEATLVEQLRSDGDVVISMVAVESGVIMGHAMLSKMAAPFRAVGLGPVSIAREQQRKGIGSALVRSTLRKAKEAGWQGVFVLGDPDWYRKFGFDPVLARGFESPYVGPHLMALSFDGPLPVLSGKIDYAPAFAALGYAKPPCHH